MTQLMPLPLTDSCFIRLVLPFWYRLTWVVPEKGPLNGCAFVCVCDSNHSSNISVKGRGTFEGIYFGVPVVNMLNVICKGSHVAMITDNP